MKRSMLILMSGIILSALIISGCKKKKGEQYYISDAFRSWTYFNLGSYWIYVNDSTLVTDSVFLRYKPQDVAIPLSSTTYPPTVESITTYFSSVFYSNSLAKVDDSWHESFQMVFKNDPAFYPWGLLASSSDNFDTLSVGTGYNTLSKDSVFYIGPTQYFNVVNTQCADNSLSKIYTFWFAKSIGLIRVVFRNGNSGYSWSLVRHHVV